MFESSMKLREIRILLPSRLEPESNIFESFMSTLLKIVFPLNQNVCMKQQLF